MTPSYLSELLPFTVSQYNPYSLRNNANFVTPNCRLDCYKTSFFPSSIELWNNLSVDCRSVTSLNLFKKSISNITRATAPKCYYNGERNLLFCIPGYETPVAP